MDKKEVDITENVACGCVDHLISILRRWREIGFDRLYFDGYNAQITLYKTKTCSEVDNQDSAVESFCRGL